MTTKFEQTDRPAIETVVAGLETAWNAADGTAFASVFAEDADLVNVYGMHGKGKQAIADAHNMIFRTVYAGSVVRYKVTQARMIADDVALAHIAAHLEVPQGPLAGEMNAAPSVVLKRNGTEWNIVAFHNTIVQPPPPLHNNGQPRP